MTGLCLAVAGLLLFFNQRLGDFIGNLTDDSFGALLVLFAAFAWATYALAQKQLLKTESSFGILFVLYAVGTVATLSLSTPTQIRGLSAEQHVVLIYTSGNALIGYVCFAEALQHWDASRVSMVVCTTPLLALAFSHPAHAIWPERVMPDNVNAIGWAGAMLIVAGSMLAAFGARPGKRPHIERQFCGLESDAQVLPDDFHAVDVHECERTSSEAEVRRSDE